MLYEIFYNQTATERYDTDMNANVRGVLESNSVEIVEEFGGCMLGSSPDALCADAGFVVDTTLETLNGLSASIQEIVGRDVNVTEVAPE